MTYQERIRMVMRFINRMTARDELDRLMTRLERDLVDHDTFRPVKKQCFEAIRLAQSRLQNGN